MKKILFIFSLCLVFNSCARETSVEDEDITILEFEAVDLESLY